jgi:hypothetical protein
MPLDFQNVPISFTGGIDKEDQLLVSPRQLTVLENCVFDDMQTIITRPGLLSLSLSAKVPTVPAPYTRTNPSYSGASYRMSQNLGSLLLESANGLFSRSPYQGGAGLSDPPSMLQVRTDTATALPGRSDFARASVETDFIGETKAYANFSASGYGLLSYDMGRIENYDGNGRVASMHAWVEVPVNGLFSGIRIRVFDEGESTSGGEGGGRTELFDLAVPPSGVAAPAAVRVLSNSTTFYVMTQDVVSGVIRVQLALNISTGVVTYPTYTATAFVAWPSAQFDAIVDPSDGLIVISYVSALNTLRIAKLNSGVTAESAGVSIAITDSDLTTLTLCRTNSSGTVRFQAFYNCDPSAATIRSVAATSAFASVAEQTVIVAAGTVSRIAVVDPGSAFTVSEVFYDIGGSGVFQTQSLKATLLGFGGATSIAVNASIYARPLYDTTLAKVHLPVCYARDAQQPSIFIVAGFLDHSPYAGVANYPSVVEARIHWGAAGYLNEQVLGRNRVPSTFFDTTSGDMILPAVRKGAQSVTTSSEITSTQQIFQARVKFTTNNLNYVEVGGDTILAGSCPQVFDGANFQEAGFSHRPVITGVTFGLAASGSLLNTGPYFFQATYIWTDSKGNQVESEPSAVFPGTPVNNNCSYNLAVTPCGITSKQDVQIRIYRSLVNAASGALLYLDNATANTASAGITDALITANSLVPTASALPNQPMPSCRVAITHQNRVWCAGGELGNQIFFSQPLSQNIFPEWDRTRLRRDIPATAGRVVNIVSLDDKLVVFCENRIGFIYGEGPTRLGENDSYSQFVEAVSGYAIPWTEPNSIIRSTDGVWFRCGFGVRLLTRALSVAKEQNGQDLASELDSSISAVVIKRALISTATQQVRFYTASDCYVYDSNYRQWSTFRFTSVADATSIGDDYYHVNNEGSALFVNTRHARTDLGAQIVSTLETAWVALAGVQGYQRLSRVQLIGQTKVSTAAGFSVTVQAGYDYDDAPSAMQTIAPTYTFPQISSAGASVAVYESESQFTVQKCRAIKLKITWVSNADTLDEPEALLRLTSMNLRLGLKQGRAKLADSLRK